MYRQDYSQPKKKSTDSHSRCSQFNDGSIRSEHIELVGVLRYRLVLMCHSQLLSFYMGTNPIETNYNLVYLGISKLVCKKKKRDTGKKTIKITKRSQGSKSNFYTLTPIFRIRNVVMTSQFIDKRAKKKLIQYDSFYHKEIHCRKNLN